MLPEVEDVVWFLLVGHGVPLLAVDEVRELHRVVDEEHGGVVANHIVVALLSVELNCEASGVSHCIGGASLTGDGREPEETGGLLSDGVEESSLGKFGYILGNLEDSVGCGSLGVHDSLGDSLSVETSEFVNEIEVLEQDGASGAGSHRVLVIVHRVS